MRGWGLGKLAEMDCTFAVEGRMVEGVSRRQE